MNSVLSGTPLLRPSSLGKSQRAGSPAELPARLIPYEVLMPTSWPSNEKTPDIRIRGRTSSASGCEINRAFAAGYHIQDPESGKTISITFWQSHEGLAALSGQTPPGGSMGLHPVIEMFTAVERF